jgi:hypothetical protein
MRSEGYCNIGGEFLFVEKHGEDNRQTRANRHLTMSLLNQLNRFLK